MLTVTIGRRLQSRADASEKGISTEVGGQPKSAEVLEWMITTRARRNRYLPDELLGEPGWDMLLCLLHAEVTGKNVSVSSLCLASGRPPTTGLRWVHNMEIAGLLTRYADTQDHRRIFIKLGSEMRESMQRYLREVITPKHFHRIANPMAPHWLVTAPISSCI
jgi:DNA-binding MarR family transcriptional regulator